MDHSHQTARCPSCGKDSYASEYEAWFGTATCTWCGSTFKYDIESKWKGQGLQEISVLKEGFKVHSSKY